MSTKGISFATCLLLALWATLAIAASPDAKLNYQKKLTAAPTVSTTPVGISYTFSLWNTETGGDIAVNRIWSETKSISVTTTTRLFSTLLGDTIPLNPAIFNQQLWVQVETGGQVIGSRDKLAIVPYAVWSATSDMPGPQGPVGPMGPQGPAGPPGPAPNLTSYYTKTQVEELLAAAVPKYSVLDASATSTCGLTNMGYIQCWGNDATINAGGGGFVFKSVSTADDFACGVTNEGQLVCWGDYPWYRTGGSSPTWQPLDPDGLPFTYAQVSVGGRAVLSGGTTICALRTPDAKGEAEVLCWSYDNHLGRGTTFGMPARPYAQISANYGYVCAIEKEMGSPGRGVCAGNEPPVSFTSGDLKQISAGQTAICSITSTHEGNELRCSGESSASDITHVPDQVREGNPTQVSTGTTHACAVLGSGMVSCWGIYGSGPTGDIPATSPGYGNFTQVAAGSIHDCGIQSNGRTICWGRTGTGGASAALLNAPKP